MNTEKIDKQEKLTTMLNEMIYNLARMTFVIPDADDEIKVLKNLREIQNIINKHIGVKKEV